jgi:hypothetical protein
MKLAEYEQPEQLPLLTRGPECTVVAREAGFQLFPWQQRVLDKSCAVDAQERFTHQRVTLICPRRNGKTQLVMARILAECLLWSDPDSPAVVLYTAHLGDTARHVFTTFLDLLYNSPWLQSMVDPKKGGRIGYGKGDESVTFTNGAKFHIRARTNSGGRGLECTTLILDEALELKPDHMAALTPLLAKAQARGSGQLWLVSSAGYGKSVVLGEARDRGRAGGPGAGAYFEWTVPRDADPTDPAVRAAANPSVGTVVLSDDFLVSQLHTMNLEDFGREHLGWWTDQLAIPFLPHGAWAQCAAAEPPELPRRARIAFGVELGDMGKQCALVAAVQLPDGTAWVETIQRWAHPDGLDPAGVAADVLKQVKQKRPVMVSGDSYTSGPLLDHLEASGVKVTRLNASQVRDASQTLLAAVTATRVAHPVSYLDDQEMDNAGRAPTGDGLDRLSRKSSTGPSVAAFATAAALHVILGPQPARPQIHTARTA